MIFYIEDLKESTKRLLELFNDFNMVAGFMSGTWKIIIFLYTKTHMKIHIFLKYNLQLFPQNKILMHKCNKTFKGCVASKL